MGETYQHSDRDGALWLLLGLPACVAVIAGLMGVCRWRQSRVPLVHCVLAVVGSIAGWGALWYLWEEFQTMVVHTSQTHWAFP